MMKRNFVKILSISLSMLYMQNASAADTDNFKQYARLSQSNYIKSDYAKTKYPIVMAHGMLGFGKLGIPDFGVDYWYQIVPDLARNGGHIWTTVVSPFDSTEVRGEQLVEQVEEILAITGDEKVNLIGHSQGVPTSRYVATVMPDQVASITGVAGVNKGSPAVDFVLSMNGTPLEQPVLTFFTLFSKVMTFAQSFNPASFPVDPQATGYSMSTAQAPILNKKYPGGLPDTACGDGPAVENGIRYYSFTGTAQATNFFDAFDNVFRVTSPIINNNRDNDGLVPRCSTKLGVTIRDNYRWNHIDEINQLLGLTSIFAANPVSVYRQHANRLKLQGL